MKKVIIIAEAGVNHNGDIEIAKKLIDAAVDAKVDYVKFQTFKANNIASSIAKKAQYQIANTESSGSQLEMLKQLELSDSDHDILLRYCEGKGINFLSTAFDLESIDLLRSINIKLGKIPSGEITNLPYLRKMAQSFSELIISTGMCDIDEVADALDVILGTGFNKERITILHCNTEYPTPFEDVNLRAMETLGKAFDVKVGYSDHTLGIEVPIAAVALGAVVIEKHFTLSRGMEGPDHKASLEPNELKAMVLGIRNIESALGIGTKTPSASELKNREIARKSIVAKTNIKQGDLFTELNLTVKRPGNGISPMLWDNVVGTIAKRNFQVDELIEL